MEQFKSLDFMGFSKYEISTFGNVRNAKTQKVLSPQLNGGSLHSKYLTVRISNDDGKYFTLYIHRLVAQAFLEQTEGKTEVNHKDENKKNNNVENLE